MKNRLCVLLCLLLTVSAMAQRGSSAQEPYAQAFRQADSLLREGGLPRSAVSVLQRIYEQAGAAGQPVQQLKAQLYLLQATVEEDADTVRIATAVREARESVFPYQAVWHSIAAQLYFSYYQQHRWEILRRTPVNATGRRPLSEWDAPQFFRVIARHYDASLAEPERLRALSLRPFAPVLTGDSALRKLRPTLFDLLAFRALDYYGNDEKDLPQLAFRFTVDDPRYLADAATFIRLDLSARDSSSLQRKALLLYQDILRLHVDDAQPAALIDADLQRLAFVYGHAVFTGKKAAYDLALSRLAQRYADHPGAAEARYRRAALRYEDDPRPGKRQPAEKSTTPDIASIRAELLAIMRQYPRSEGAVHAQALLGRIDLRELSVQSEEVILPDEYSKVLLTYRNLAQIRGRVIALSEAQYNSLWRNEGDGKTPELLLRAKPVQTFSHSLPAAEDHAQHTAELPIDPLPAGRYAVLVSGDDAFSATDNNLSYVLLQASSLSLILQDGEGSGFVLHRKTGRPVAGAQLEFYRQEWRSGKYIMQKAAASVSGADGSFRINGSNLYFNQTVIRYNGSVLYMQDGLSAYRNTRANAPQQQTFFFTDRSIYRPGQTISFKAIVLKKSADGRQVKVVPGTATKVTFYDANGRQLKSLPLTTNEWGSCAGSFTAPETGLTGSMRIANEWGETYVSVEAYKRPRFAVSFDTLQEAVVLNGTVRVTGKAMAYAGQAIDGANVEYHVMRETRWPYPGLYRRIALPAQAEAEIAHGNVQTDAQGGFAVSFKALPDEQADTSLLPFFTYRVEASVTDAAGETRSTATSVQAGYRSVQIEAAVPELSAPAQLDTLQVRITSLNGHSLRRTLSIRIAPLQSPRLPLRARRWPQPDQYVLDEPSFRRLFPLDEYRKESRPEEWPAGVPVLERSFVSNERGQVVLPAHTFRNGWYELLIRVRDDAADAWVEDRRYVQVWDGASMPASPLAAMAGHTVYAPGETARAAAGSAYPAAHILRLEKHTGGQLIAEQEVNGQPWAWTRPLTEADRGGIGLQWLMVRDNRVYTAAQLIAVPWTSKELDLSWATHRDRVQPGAQETWTLTIRGARKERVAAELAAGLYDASLDAFRPHGWNLSGLFPEVDNGPAFGRETGFGIAYNRVIATPSIADPAVYDKAYERLILPEPAYLMYGYGGGRSDRTLSMASPMRAAAMEKAPAPAANVAQQEEADASGAPGAGRKSDTPVSAPPPLRRNLQETAFFYPQLHTDAEGNVQLRFTLPEALTEWKFLALAHTKDLAVGQLSGQVKTQKDLMVQPNLPRFFRQGDELVIAAKISNLTGGALSGSAVLEIVDAQTLQPQQQAFALRQPQTPFTAAAGQSTTATWRIRVPESRYEPVLVRISATSGRFTDGEEHLVPVLTNRLLVTETLPLWMNGNGKKSFTWDRLLHSDTSRTLSPYRLTVEYTANPAWYAVQALPYLMEYPHECAEQTFNRYYANALAAHILDRAPRVKQLFDTWGQDTAALRSKLLQNQELKSALLEETPWVLDAKDETEQQQNIARLFDSYRLGRSQDAALERLEQLLLPEGAFPWFKGMDADRYITQYIATGIARLERLGVRNDRSARLRSRMLAYLDRKAADDYAALVKSGAKPEEQHIDQLHVQYLYLRSFMPDAATDSRTAAAFAYYRQQAARYWPGFSPYLKGMTALALHRLGDPATARRIVASLRETAVRKEELGMYWPQSAPGYWWYEAPVEAQSLLVECFSEVAKDNAAADELKRWLLKQKQARSWSTTKATADACYALLLNGSQWLSSSPQVSIQLGDRTVQPDGPSAGTGYFKQSFAAAEIRPEMGQIAVSMAAAQSSAPSWGSVYWQYFERMDKVAPAATPLSVRRQLFIRRHTDRGAVLDEIGPGSELQLGDEVIVRMVLQSDRDMEYLHLKDMRAACFEPVNVLSGYRWASGFGYYESTLDASSHFFISHLRRGSYVFEYPVRVMAKGRFTGGVASIQCMYAPEFSSHTEGAQVEVK